jgi:sterol desaturase/sphingolipid hydroxylase (fatty acid hydroxylase superfamily)
MGLFLSYLPVLAVVAALTLAERARNPARSDWWINIQAWAVKLLLAFTILPLFRITGMPSLLDGTALPFWVGFPLFVVVSDLGEFLYHRAQHRVPLLWAMHSLHHSDPEMSALTTERHFWGDQLLKSLTIWAAASMVIAPTWAIIFAAGLVSLWNFFSHSRLNVNLGRWSWLINTPAYHRRHHSRLPEHYDSNFAALFPIFDVICGSYNRPDGFPPTGLDRAPRNLREIVAWPLHFSRPAPQPEPQPKLSEA